MLYVLTFIYMFIGMLFMNRAHTVMAKHDREATTTHVIAILVLGALWPLVLIASTFRAISRKL